MATLTELGRNSATVQYGPSGAGADLFPTLQAVDTWLRNDTYQGTATSTQGNSSSLTGVGSAYVVQARQGDVIMVAGQMRTLSATPTTEALTVTSPFSPTITTASAVKAINPVQNTQTAGYVSSFVRGSTYGTVNVTSGSATITGVGTYFLAEATSSVTTVSMAGTIAIDTTGAITGSGTSFLTGQGIAPAGQNGLYPGDCITVTQPNGAVYYFVIATVSGDNGSSCATVTVAPTTAIASGSAIAKATNGATGRLININGRVRSIVAIASNTSMTVSIAMDFTDSNLKYKVYPRGTLSNSNAAAGAVFSGTATGTGTSFAVTSPTPTGSYILPGSIVYAASGITAGTTIVSQTVATSATINNTSVAGTANTNILTTSGTQTGTIVVGMLVQTAASTAFANVPAGTGTYVVGITGTSPNFTITLSQNITSTVSGTVYFAYPGGAGTYITSLATTISAASFTISNIVGLNTNFFWDLGSQNLNSSTSTPYMYQTSLLDQVWIGDEARTLNFNSFTGTITSATATAALNCYVTDYIGYSGAATGIIRQTVYLKPFKRDDTFINGTSNRLTSTAISLFTSDLRVGDDLIIDGTEVTVTQIINDSQFKVNFDFTHTTAANSGGAATVSRTYSSGGAAGASTIVLDASTSVAIGQLITGIGIAPATYVSSISQSPTPNTITISNALLLQASGTYNLYNGTNFYKKLKLHGYSLEGTREGGTAGTGNNTKWSQAVTLAGGTGTSYPIGTTTLTVSSAPTQTGAYLFAKISGAGGTPLVMAGQINTVSASATVTGTNTLFTSQLHIGAEIIIADQYFSVTAIASDTSLTVNNTLSVTGPVPYYRSVPLYTYITAGTTSITLATPIKNNLYVQAANPPQVFFPSTGADFIEYVYSAPNYGAQYTTAGAAQTSTFTNQSNDRKYVGFRMFPLFQSTNTGPTATAALATAFGAYATPVYERWTASYGQTHGVGINQADLSGGVVMTGAQVGNTTFTIAQPVAGSLTVNMGIQGLGTGYPNPVTALTSAAGTQGAAASTYTATTATIGAASVVAASLYGVYDITAMTQVTGGYLYLFANPRYFAVQGKSFANLQTQWVGCLEFERAQPEDAVTGTGVTTGITFGGTYGGAQLSQGSNVPTQAAAGFNQNVVQYTSGVAPWPCFGYVNGNRLPTGAQQIPTLPALETYPIHGCVISVPRVRNSATDLVGFNAHVYSSLTITTGRWGHTIEFGNYGGSYNPAYLGTNPTATSSTLANVANSLPQLHMGQLIPVYTNIYNSKRFMFSPVVVLGTAYDPDVRGRIYGMKLLPSALGTLMDTVSITSNGSAVPYDWFYNTAATAQDHWILTTPPSFPATTAVNYPGQQGVLTTRFTNTQNGTNIQQSWRSLEDSGTQLSSTATIFLNNFRFAFPA